MSEFIRPQVTVRHSCSDEDLRWYEFALNFSFRSSVPPSSTAARSPFPGGEGRKAGQRSKSLKEEFKIENL